MKLVDSVRDAESVDDALEHILRDGTRFFPSDPYHGIQMSHRRGRHAFQCF
jgi:hypothetical protein